MCVVRFRYDSSEYGVSFGLDPGLKTYSYPILKHHKVLTLDHPRLGHGMEPYSTPGRVLVWCDETWGPGYFKSKQVKNLQRLESDNQKRVANQRSTPFHQHRWNKKRRTGVKKPLQELQLVESLFVRNVLDFRAL